MRYRIDRLRALLRDVFADLPKRARLTVEYLGWRAFFVRAATFPLRLTPWGPRMAATRATHWARAREWYRRHGRDVAIVIPNYGDPRLTLQCVDSIRATTKEKGVRIIVSDDGSAPEHVATLQGHAGIDEVVVHPENTGFAANCNRGFERTGGDTDVILLNSDVIAMPGWLELLQYGAYKEQEVGIAGPKLLYPDGTIQSAGTHRNLGAPEWFDHRHRFRPSDYPPANVVGDMLAMTGAALYIKPRVLRELGGFDEGYGMAYEDVDLCLRCWEAGQRVLYVPESTMTHLESKTRPVEPGPRELESQRYFWERWGDWFDARGVRTASGALRVIYVTEDTGVGGGHRVVFEHLNGLKERGHEAELWTLGERGGDPDWFDLKVPVRTFEDWGVMVHALDQEDAIKVATWWATSPTVWRGSVRRGIPAFFVQDIETSYYPDQPLPQAHVMSSYRHEFRYLTTSQWVGDQLRELHVDPVQVAPGVDLEVFHQLEGIEREDGVLLAVGRSNPLKNFPLTAAAWQAVPEDKRPELWLFGIEPQIGAELGARYFERPSDTEVNELYNRATALIQTSSHEGFCLPLLEAMAAGAATICTDSHGNRDFIRDGDNCLLVDATEEAVAAAIERLFGDPELRARLVAGGLRTAAEYDYPKKLDEVAAFFESVSAREAGAAPA
jgi:GT2 family glycosyltransferase